MKEPSRDVAIALRRYGDQAQSEEVLIAPALTLLLGIRHFYLNPGRGSIAVIPVQWLSVEEAEAELKKQAEEEERKKYPPARGYYYR